MTSSQARSGARSRPRDLPIALEWAFLFPFADDLAAGQDRHVPLSEGILARRLDEIALLRSWRQIPGMVEASPDGILAADRDDSPLGCRCGETGEVGAIAAIVRDVTERWKCERARSRTAEDRGG